jgi:hypothetical protein
MLAAYNSDLRRLAKIQLALRAVDVVVSVLAVSWGKPAPTEIVRGHAGPFSSLIAHQLDAGLG